MTTNAVSYTISPEKIAGRLAMLALHTLAVYIFAVHFSPWLIGRWFTWIAPALQISTTLSPGDWYLRHLELVSIVPGLLAGYIVARRFWSVASWAFLVPTLVLIYNMLRYEAPSSVLFASSTPAIRYYFDIEQSMPTVMNPTSSDPVRLLAQMTITAPFYTAIAYSLGALVSKNQLLIKLFSFEKGE